MEIKGQIGQKVLVEVEIAEIHIDAESTKYILKGTAQKNGFKVIADESEVHSLDECQKEEVHECKTCRWGKKGGVMCASEHMCGCPYPDLWEAKEEEGG